MNTAGVTASESRESAMRIAVVQHRLGANPSEDMSALAAASARAVAAGAEWVVLPTVLSIETSPEPFLAACTPPDVLGSILELQGDECCDAGRLASARRAPPDVAVLRPQSENDLQSEAFLELAIDLSDSLAGVIIVAECFGAEPGDPGHGGSAVVVLGEVVAEALADDDLIFADIAVPIAHPEPREPLPLIPLLLRQRAAFHAGHKLEVPEYPADIG